MLHTDYTKAVKEIESFLQIQAGKAQANGWSFFECDIAPETFKRLKEFKDGKHLPIANYGSNTSIYSSSKVNTLFRFYHDVTHLELDQGFSIVGEMAVANKHLEDAKEYGLSNDAMQVLFADTAGQVAYYFRNKRFVDNQAVFVQEYLKHPRQALMTKI